jgi:hypothetical protein
MSQADRERFCFSTLAHLYLNILYISSIMIIAIASAKAKENIIDKNILLEAEGLRPNAFIDSAPTKAITKEGPAIPKNNAIIATSIFTLRLHDPH